MEEYIDISLECEPFFSQELDLRVPISLTIKELVQIIMDRYGLGIQVLNPIVRNKQTGEVLASTSRLESVKNGALLQLENIG